MNTTTTTEQTITISGVKGVEGVKIPRDRLLATYTPRDNLRTPPTLLLEWDEANLFFTGLKANDVRRQLVAQEVSVETIFQREISRHV